MKICCGPSCASAVGVIGVAPAEKEVPFDAFGGISVGLHPVWRDLAVEQERELESEDA